MKLTTFLLVILGVVVLLLMQKKPPATQAESILTSELQMGAVELVVNDLEKQQHFYQTLVGLSLLEETEVSVVLGHEDRPVIKLRMDTTKPSPATGSAGLYHTATVFESRAALAQALQRTLAEAPELYSGSADHLVSEAFYFNDPEGNGVELYFDKDPSTWVWHNGQVEMGSVFIDIHDYISEHAFQSATPAKKMGHVHLKVGSIAEAKQFYVDVLGFRVTAEMPTALFVSDGQYHHNLGMNVWESTGAGKREASTGLSSLVLLLDKQADLDKLETRLTESGIRFEKKDNQVIVFDPWLNQVVFTI